LHGLPARLERVHSELKPETPGVLPEHFVAALLGG
jgi:hypothetical protein